MSKTGFLGRVSRRPGSYLTSTRGQSTSGRAGSGTLASRGGPQFPGALGTKHVFQTYIYIEVGGSAEM
jgi:hypothetical protein